ncbi:thioester reductase domain-containing protein [Catenulispora rubra]|uniref:thioester reductase domain-containing protein n=1 Tax=Catenulispora rubra TaxID=280293 RepID=UPI00189252B0|nr:thioester reductase domain-containing protein [Catenulispora rubra]
MTTLQGSAVFDPAVQDVFPLSFAQERIWFLEQLDPGSAAFTITAALQVRGRLDPAALDRALTALADRHEVLRTRFDHDGTAPVQIIAPDAGTVLRIVDVSGLPGGQARAAAEAIAVRQAHSSFDLRQGPMMRAALVRIAAKEGLLLIVLHHTVCDGWSADLLIRDLAELYRAELRGEPPELPELPIQYADFAVWQRETLAESGLDEQLAYWKRALAGVPRVLDLPTDRPRPAEQDFGGAMTSRELGPDLAAALVDAARAEGATPFMLLLAAYQSVLARRSGQPAFLVGTPVSGRTRPETAELLGCFINMLALPADVAGDPTVRELLARVRRTCLDGYAHQDLPFEHLVTELDPPRDLGRAPLAQVLLAVQDGLSGDVEVEGVTLAPAPVASGVASYDLTLDAQLAAEGFRLNLVYATALFESATAEGILEDVVAVLTAMSESLDIRISDLPIGAGLEAADEIGADEVRRIAAEVLGTSRATDVLAAGDAAALADRSATVGICIRDDAVRESARTLARLVGTPFLELDPTAPPAYVNRHLNTVAVLLTDREDLAALPALSQRSYPLAPAQISRDLVFPLRALTGDVPTIGLIDFTGVPALPGARGELWISGTAEPLYHLGGAAQTAEVLTPAPGGARRLHTGRTARLVNGAVELLDPPDLSELEFALRAHPDVTAAAAVYTAAGETVAVHAPAEVEDLAAHLAAELPARLLPDRYLGLPELPDTPEALLAATAQRTSGYEGAVRPRTHLERAILDCFGTALDRRDIGIHDDFFDAGGTSLTAARLIVALPEAVGMPVPLKTLFTHSTVATLAAALEGPDGPGVPDSAVEMALHDEQLPADIVPSGTARPAPPDGGLGCVLLTGGTGFLGGHMIAELLRNGATEIVCLVRGENPAERLAANLADYDQDDVDPAKLTILPGDLTLPRFGLDEAGFAELADRLDIIYHCAAHMNFILPYRVLRAPNVVGTTEILRLACTGRPTPVHYVSTIDMRVGDVLPERPGPLDAGTSDGYVLSKKTGEHLVLEAGRRGLPVGVYRPWLITGATGTGAVGVRDQLALCLAGSLIAALMPEDTPIPLHVLPVDLVSAAIVRLSRHAPRSNPVHQFYNPQVAPMKSIHEYLTRTGYRFDTVPYAQWRVQLARRTAGRLDGLAALLSIDGPMNGDPDVVEIGNSLSGLGGDAGFPAIDVDYVAKTVAFLVRQGMVPELSTSGAQ